MEAHGCRDFPPDSVRGRFVAPRAAGRRRRPDRCRASPRSCCRRRAPAGRSRATWPGAPAVYLQRAHALRRRRPARAQPRCEPIWRAVLGDARPARRSTTLFARLIWIPDGDIDALDRAARALPRDHRPARPDRPATATAATPATARRGDGAAADASRRRRRRDRRRRRRRRRGLAGRGARARDRDARAGQLEQLDEDVDLQPLLDAGRPRRPRRAARGGRGTGAPSGRMPDRGVDRPPFAGRGRAGPPLRHPAAPGDHARHAHGSTSARPAGASTAAPTRAARRSAPTGRPVSTHPWQITRQVTRADPGAARRAGHRHLRLDERLRVRARPDRLDPHRRRCARSAAAARSRCSATAPSCSADGTRADCALVPGDPHRRRHRVRRRRDRARLRPARDDQPAPPALRLRALRRRLVRHAGRRRADPLAAPSTASRPSTSRSASRRCRSRPTASSSSPTPPTRSTDRRRHRRRSRTRRRRLTRAAHRDGRPAPRRPDAQRATDPPCPTPSARHREPTRSAATIRRCSTSPPSPPAAPWRARSSASPLEQLELAPNPRRQIAHRRHRAARRTC